MKNYDAFKKEFEELTHSVLAKEDAEIEEVAIWLELNNLTSYKSLTRLFRIISFFYHSSCDFPNSAYAVYHSAYAVYPPCQIPVVNTPYSDIMFKNLFYVMFHTNSLDKAISKKEFMNFATKLKDNCKHSAVQHKDRSSLDLYEVYAELVDRLKKKFA